MIAFLDALIRAEDDGADRVFFEVEGDAGDAPLEFEHLERLGGLQAIDLRDPVAHLGDDADISREDRDVEFLDAPLDQAADFF